MEFASDASSSCAAAAAAAAAPVEVDIDWGDFGVVDAAAPAAASECEGGAAAAASVGGDPNVNGDVVDIDWNVVSVGDGGAAAQDISWDIDVDAGDASVADYGFSVVGADDAATNAFGISISTDGVDGQANVFEDPERCHVFRARFFCCALLFSLTLPRRTLLLADVLGTTTVFTHKQPHSATKYFPRASRLHHNAHF
jgi:hypothetical protein